MTTDYEAFCRDYSLTGNPERDAMDYDDNARFDRFDSCYSTIDHNCGDMEPCESEPTPEPAEPSEPSDYHGAF